MFEGMEIGKATLNVKNVEKMSEFYQRVIGLEVLSGSFSEVHLGIKADNRVLLTLKQSKTTEQVQKAGLYHIAFLLPTREALSSFLKRLIQLQTPIQGASDHGYSEAVYLGDPEGNGIEVYSDKPTDTWDVNEAGEIAGITIQIDAEGLMGLNTEPQEIFPAGTIIGHMHLSVIDLNISETYYKDLLGFDLKFNYGGHAKFLASGFYHHHIAFNTWQGRTPLVKREEEDLGLRNYEILLPDEKTKEAIKANLLENDYAVEEADNTLITTDPNGIVLHLIIK